MTRVLLALVGTTLLASAMARPAPDGGWRVAREAGEWVIEADAGPREALARQLAAISGSTWAQPAGAEVLAGARPLTLRWRGRDLAAAWAAVLGGEASHAVQCRPAGCRVWVLGLLPSSPPLSLPSPSMSMSMSMSSRASLPRSPISPAAAASVRDRPVGVPAARRAPDPSSARDVGAAGGVPAEPPAEPLQVDPPGLFSGG